MNTQNSQSKQRGFFDLGFSLALLAILGVISVAGTNDSPDTPQQLASCNDAYERSEYSKDCRS